MSRLPFPALLSGHARKVVSGATAVLLMALWAPVVFTPGSSANTTGNRTLGNFEIDGNLYDGYNNASTSSTPVAGALDWVNLAGQPVARDPIGKLDTTNFSVGSKENQSPDAWSGGSGTVSPKDDIQDVYVASSIVPPLTGHEWGYFGVTRVSADGTTYFDFELNQAANHINPNGISVPTRTIGDTLLVAQEQGSGSFVISATIQRWTTSGWSAPVTPGSDVFYGLSNDSSIPNLPGSDNPAGGLGGSLSTATFGEMAVDLTALGAALGCPSKGYTALNLRTRSSISADAELKDYVGAPINIPSNCGELKIEKFGPDGTTPLAGATFKISPNPLPGQGGAGTYLTVTDGGTNDADGIANGVVDINPAVPGSYTVTETAAPPGYLLDSSSNPVTVTAFGSGTNAAVTSFINHLGSVTFFKVDGAGHALCCATFEVKATSGAAAAAPWNIDTTVTDNSAPDQSPTAGTINLTGLPTGTYSVHETAAPAGYTLDPSTQTFTISVATPNPSLSTAFVDVRILSTLFVKKTDAAGNPLAGAHFSLYQEKVAGTENMTLDSSNDTLIASCTTLGNGECSINNLDWGGNPYYWVETAAPTGYNLPDVVNAPIPGISITAANAGTTFPVTTFADTQSKIVTTATSSATLPTASISDSATLSGVRSSAAGTITFDLYGPADPSCTGTPVFVSAPFNVAGNGTYGPATTTATAAGTYHWIATYSGDTLNQPVSGLCGDAGETTVVHPAQPRIATIPSGPVTLPDVTVADSATLSGFQPQLTSDGTVSGTPDTVTFTLYGPSATANCSTTPVFTSTVNITAGGTASSGAAAVTKAGNYWWTATYNGDPNNLTASSACGAEESVVHPAQPAIATTPSGPVTLPGVSISDSATLSGFQPQLTSDGTVSGTPDTVTFKLYGPSIDASCTGTPVATSTANIAADGTASGSAVPVTKAGNYWWTATYNGDPNNLTATSACGTEESVVHPAQPTISTTPTNGTLPNATVSDSATLSGFQPPLTGNIGGAPDTVTFTLYGPSATANCTTTPVFTSTVGIAADGTAQSGVAPVSTAGNYWWTATYNGDPNNLPASSGCGAEKSVVAPASPTITTIATDATAVLGTIDDVATLAGGTPNATGAVTFNVYDTATCSGAPVFTSTVQLVNGTTATSAPFTIPSGNSAANYYWVASYAGDLNNTAVSGVCGDAGETSRVPLLGLTKTAVPASGSVVQPGSTIAYTIDVPNTGTVPATGVTVVDTLPSNVTADASTISPATGLLDSAAGTITWSGLTIPVGGLTLSYSVTVNVNAPQGGTLTNVATLTEGSFTLSASTVHHLPTGALTLVKVVDHTTANYGDTLTYGFGVGTTGDLNHTNAVVSDVIPTGTTYVLGSASCDGTCTIAYDAATRTLTWALGSVPAGTTRTLGFKVTINKATPAADGSISGETITNVGSIRSDQQPPTASNVVTTTVVAVLGVKFTKAPTPLPVKVLGVKLPFTGVGVPVGDLVGFGILLLVGGAASIAFSTRRLAIQQGRHRHLRR